MHPSSLIALAWSDEELEMGMQREYTPDGMPEHRRSTSISRREINQSCFSFRSDKNFFSDLKDSVWSTLTVTGEFISACKALIEGACQFMSSFHSWKCLRMVLINSLALSPNKTRRGSRHCPLQHLSECLVFLAKDNQLCLVKDWPSPLRISEMFFFFYSRLLSSARLVLELQCAQLVKFQHIELYVKES